MGFQKMADNEVLGDRATQFFKSGNILRSDKNKPLEKLQGLLPLNGPNNTNIEYDLWYDNGDTKRVRGYVYTDAMCQLLYIRPAGAHFARKLLLEAREYIATPDGEAAYKAIQTQATDKYALRAKGDVYSFVIFLPGTNIFRDSVDQEKLRRAVEQGAYIKPHPITADGLLVKLSREYGDRVLDKKQSGYELLDSASIVGTCVNSEIGLRAKAMGKSVYGFDAPRAWGTYRAMYEALDIEAPKHKYDERFIGLLSAPYSGVISVHHEDAEYRIQEFFRHYERIEHVAPRNPSS